MVRILLPLVVAIALCSSCGGNGDKPYAMKGGAATLLDGSPAPQGATPVSRAPQDATGARYFVGYLVAPTDDSPRLCSHLTGSTDCYGARNLILNGSRIQSIIDGATVLRHGSRSTGSWSPHPVALRGYLAGGMLFVTSSWRLPPRKRGVPAGLRLRAFAGPSDRRDLDLDLLVPPKGRLSRLWLEPGAGGRVAVAWTFRGRWTLGWYSTRRYALTVWRRTQVVGGSARWVPQTVVRASPYPLTSDSVSWADATHDGRSDLLVTIACSDCNHGAQVESIYGTVGGRLRHLYGSGYFNASKGLSGPGVRGRVDIETSWGVTKGGLVFFAVGGLTSQPYWTLTLLRWTAHGWRTVSARRLPLTAPMPSGLVR